MRRKITDAAESNTLSGDTYLKNGGSLIGLFSVRLVLLCVFTVSLVWFLCDVYMLELDLPLLLCYTALLTAALYTLSSVLYSPAVYGAGAFVLALAAFVYNFDPQLFYKTTGTHFLLYLNGRLLSTAQYAAFASEEMLKVQPWQDRLLSSNLTLMLFVAAFLVLLSVIVFRKKYRVFAAAAMISVLLVPSFVAERITFYPSFAFLFGCCVAMYAVRSGYELEGAYLFGKYSLAHTAQRRDERSFKNCFRFSALGNKLGVELPRYGKFGGNAVILLILVPSLMLSVYALSGKGNYIDYTKLYESVTEIYGNISSSIGDLFSVSFGEVSDNGYFVDYESAESVDNGISISAPSNSNLPVLKVVTDTRAEPIYLRGDIGVDFYGESWSTLADKEFTSALDEKYKTLLSSENGDGTDYYHEVNYRILRQKLAYLGYSPNDYLPLEKVSITYQRNTRVVFQPLYPYELNYRTSDSFDSFGDFILRLKNHISGIKTYESLALVPEFTVENYSVLDELMQASDYDEAFNYRWTLPENMHAESFVMSQELYNEYVKSVYTTVPESEWDNIARFLEDTTVEDYDAADGPEAVNMANYLCELFKTNYSYSLTVDNTGKGNTTLGTFLLDTEEGHCALYATAMTLALRYQGIPARYVTGYVINGYGTANDGGYEYVMRESNLHAWVEVYIEELGIWLPFDPTPPAIIDGSATATTATTNESERTTPTFSKPATTTTTAAIQSAVGSDSVTSTYEDAPEVDVGGFDPTLLLYAVIAVIVIMLAGAIFAYYRSLLHRERKRFRGFESRDAQAAVREMYRLIIRLLALRSVEQRNGELPRVFAARVDRDNPCGGKSYTLKAAMRIIEKAEFGKPEYSPVSDEERAEVLAYTRRLYDVTVTQSNVLKRIFYKISLFS